MASETAHDVARRAAQGFAVLQCVECANKVKAALLAAGHRGQWIELVGAGSRDFIVCLSFDGGKTSITETGRHVGIRVGELMFDNLHPDGMPLADWLRDFDADGGIKLNAPVDF